MEVKKKDIVSDLENKIKLQLPLVLDNYVFSEKKAENFNSKQLAEYKKLKEELVLGLSRGEDIRSKCSNLVRLFNIEADPRRLELNIKEIYSELKVQNSSLWEKCLHGIEKGKIATSRFKEWGSIFLGAMTYHFWDREKGIADINQAIESAQDSEHSSILGTKEEFLSKRYADKPLKEMFLDKEFWNESFSLVGVNHALNIVVEPLLTPVEELGKEFTQRLAWVGYNALQKSLGESSLEYSEFLAGIEEGNNSQLNIIKGALEALEAFGIAYCMVATGGAGAASRLSRISRLQKFASNSKDALKLLFASPTSPVLMSFLGALGQVLQNKEVRSVLSAEFVGNLFKDTLRDTSQNMHFMGFLSALSRVSIIAQSFLIRRNAQQEINALTASLAAKEVISLRYEKYIKDTEKAVVLTHTLMDVSDVAEGFPDFITSLHNVSIKGITLISAPTEENGRYFLGSLCELSSSFIDLVDFSRSGEKERISKLATKDLALKDKKNVKSLWDSLEGDQKQSPLAFYDRKNDLRVTTAVSANQSAEEKAAALYFALHEDMHRIIGRTEGGLAEILLTENYSQASEVIKIKNILNNYLGIKYQEILNSDNQLAKEQLEELVCYLFAAGEVGNWAKQKNLKIQMHVQSTGISFVESETLFQVDPNLSVQLHFFVQTKYPQLNSNPDLVAAEGFADNKQQKIDEQIKSLSNLDRDDVMDRFIEVAREYDFDAQNKLFALSVAGSQLLGLDNDPERIFARLKLLCRTAYALNISPETLVEKILEQIYYNNGKSKQLNPEIKDTDVLMRARMLLQISGVDAGILNTVMRTVISRYLSLLCHTPGYQTAEQLVALRLRELRKRGCFSDKIYNEAISLTIEQQVCSSGISNLYRFVFAANEFKNDLPRVNITQFEFEQNITWGLRAWFVQATEFEPRKETLIELENFLDGIKIKIILEEARSLAIVDLLNIYSQSKDFNVLPRALALAGFSNGSVGRYVVSNELENACSTAIGQYLLVALEESGRDLYSKDLVHALTEKFCPDKDKSIVLTAISRLLANSLSFNARDQGFSNIERISSIINELIIKYKITSEELVQLGRKVIKTIVREVDPQSFYDNRMKIDSMLQTVIGLLATEERSRASLASIVDAEHSLAEFKFYVHLGDIDRADNFYFEVSNDGCRLDKLINEDSVAVIEVIKLFLSNELSRIKGAQGSTGEYLYFWDDSWRKIKKLVSVIYEIDLIGLLEQAIKDPQLQRELLAAITVQIYSGERDNALKLACLNAGTEILASLMRGGEPGDLRIDQIVEQAEERALVEALNEGKDDKIQDILLYFEENQARLGNIAKKYLTKAFYLGVASEIIVSEFMKKYSLQTSEVLNCAAAAIALLEKKKRNKKRINYILRVAEKIDLQGEFSSKNKFRNFIFEKLIQSLLKDKVRIRKKIKFLEYLCETYNLPATEFNKIVLLMINQAADQGNENLALIILENWQERALVKDFFIATIAYGNPLDQKIEFLLTICNLFINTKAEAWDLCATAFASRIAAKRDQLNDLDLEVAEELAKRLEIPSFVSQASQRALAEIVKSSHEDHHQRFSRSYEESPRTLNRRLRMGAQLCEQVGVDPQIEGQYLTYFRLEIMKIIVKLFFATEIEQREWMKYLNDLVKICKYSNVILINIVATEVAASLRAYLSENDEQNKNFSLNETAIQRFLESEFLKNIKAILENLEIINQDLGCKIAEGIIAGVFEKIATANVSAEITEGVVAFIDQLVEIVVVAGGETAQQIRTTSVICGGIRAAVNNQQVDFNQLEANTVIYGRLSEEDKERFYRELFIHALKSKEKLQKIKDAIIYLSDSDSNRISKEEIRKLFIEAALDIASDPISPKEQKFRHLNRLFHLAETFVPGMNVKERALYYILLKRTLTLKNKIIALDSQDAAFDIQRTYLKTEEQKFLKELKFAFDCSNTAWAAVVNSAQMMLLFKTLDLDYLELLNELISNNKAGPVLSELTIKSIISDLIEDRVIVDREYIDNLLVPIGILHEKMPQQYAICKGVLEKIVEYLDRNCRSLEAQSVREEINSREQKFDSEFDSSRAQIFEIINFTDDYSSLEVIRERLGWHVFDHLIYQEAKAMLEVLEHGGEDALTRFQLFCYEKGWAIAEAIEEIRNSELNNEGQFRISLLACVSERKYADLINLIEETEGLAQITENPTLSVMIQIVIYKLTDQHQKYNDQGAFLAILSLLNSKEISHTTCIGEVPQQIYILLSLIDLELQKKITPELLEAKKKVLEIWEGFNSRRYHKFLEQKYRKSFFARNSQQLKLLENILCPEGEGKEEIGINIFIVALLTDRTAALLDAVKYFKLSEDQVRQEIVNQTVKALTEKNYKMAVRLANVGSFFNLPENDLLQAIFITWILNDKLNKDKEENFFERAEIFFDLYGFSNEQFRQLLQAVSEVLRQAFPSIENPLIETEQSFLPETTETNPSPEAVDKLNNICRQLVGENIYSPWTEQTQIAYEELENFLESIESTPSYRLGERPVFFGDKVSPAAIDALTYLILNAEPASARRLARLSSSEKTLFEAAAMKAVTALIIANKLTLARQIAQSTSVDDKFYICIDEAIFRLISDPLENFYTAVSKRKEIRRRLLRIKKLVSTYNLESSMELVSKGLVECLLNEKNPRQFQAIEVLYNIYSNNLFSMVVNDFTIQQFVTFFIADALSALNYDLPIIRKLKTLWEFVLRINQNENLVIEALSHELSIHFGRKDFKNLRKIIYVVAAKQKTKELLISIFSRKEEGNENVKLAKFIIDNYLKLDNQEIVDCLVEGNAQYIACNGLKIKQNLFRDKEFQYLAINVSDFVRRTALRAIEIKFEQSTEYDKENWFEVEEILVLIRYYTRAYGSPLVSEAAIDNFRLFCKIKILETKDEEDRECLISSFNEILSIYAAASEQTSDDHYQIIRENVIAYLVESLKQSISLDKNKKSIKGTFLDRVGPTLQILGLNLEQQQSVGIEVIEKYLLSIDLNQLINQAASLRRELKKAAKIIVFDGDWALSILWEGVENATPGIIKKLPIYFNVEDEERICKALQKIGRVSLDTYDDLTLSAVAQLLMDKEWNQIKVILNRRFERIESKLKNKDRVKKEQEHYMLDAFTLCAIWYLKRNISIKLTLAHLIRLFDEIDIHLGFAISSRAFLFEILQEYSLKILHSNDIDLEKKNLSNNLLLTELREFYQEFCTFFGLSTKHKDMVVHELVIELLADKWNPRKVGKLISIFYPGHYLSLIGIAFGKSKGYDIYIFNLLEELFFIGKEKQGYLEANTLMDELKALYGKENPMLLRMFEVAKFWAKKGLVEGRRIVQRDTLKSDEDFDAGGGPDSGGSGKPSLLPKTPSGGGASVQIPTPIPENEIPDTGQGLIMPPVLDTKDQASKPNS